MMMQCIGVDIVEIARIKKAIARWGDRFLHRVYTESELRLCRKKPQSLAARFAGKEAVIKVLEETTGISWQHIEVLSESGGRPLVRLYGKAKQQAQRLGLSNISITLSHSREYAIAFVTGETK
jgi:holo-[acyl-carrier protein] synthase